MSLMMYDASVPVALREKVIASCRGQGCKKDGHPRPEGLSVMSRNRDADFFGMIFRSCRARRTS